MDFGICCHWQLHVIDLHKERQIQLGGLLIRARVRSSYLPDNAVASVPSAFGVVYLTWTRTRAAARNVRVGKLLCSPRCSGSRVVEHLRSVLVLPGAPCLLCR